MTQPEPPSGDSELRTDLEAAASICLPYGEFHDWADADRGLLLALLIDGGDHGRQ